MQEHENVIRELPRWCVICPMVRGTHNAALMGMCRARGDLLESMASAQGAARRVQKIRVLQVVADRSIV